MIEMSKHVGPWRDAVRAAAHQAIPVPLPGPVALDIVFFLEKPKSVKRETPHVRPDLDKLIRATMDGLTSTVDRRNIYLPGAFDDDAQAIIINTMKAYAPPGTMPGAWITIDRATAQSPALADARQENTA
jgi:Holliday junction resolvase RusA-like endonuclease